MKLFLSSQIPKTNLSLTSINQAKFAFIMVGSEEIIPIKKQNPIIHGKTLIMILEIKKYQVP